MHTFVVLFTAQRLSWEKTERLANEAQQYAISHKGGLPRGLQTGTATLVVFLADDVSEDAVAWSGPLLTAAAVVGAAWFSLRKAGAPGADQRAERR